MDACYCGCLNLVYNILSHHRAKSNEIINESIICACLGGHMSLVQTLIMLNVKKIIHWKKVLVAASESGNLELFQFLVEIG